MEESVLSTKEFADWGKSVVLYCNISSQVKGDKHQDLLSKKGGMGFPYMVCMDAQGRILSVFEHSRDVAGFTACVKAAKENQKLLADLSEKTKAGDQGAAKKLFFKKLELLHYSAEEGLKTMATLTLTEEEKKKANTALAGLEFKEIMGTVNQDPATHVAAGKKIWVMIQAGRMPKEHPMMMGNLAFFLMAYAEKEVNIKAFERGLEVVKEAFKDNPNVGPFIAKQAEKLKALKAKAAGAKEAPAEGKPKAPAE